MNLNVCSDPCHVVDPVCMFSIHYVKQECCLSDPGSLNFKICLEQSLMGHLSVHTGALFSSSSYIHLPHLKVHSFIFSLILPSIRENRFLGMSFIPLTFIISFIYKTIYTFIHPLAFKLLIILNHQEFVPGNHIFYIPGERGRGIASVYAPDSLT